MEKYYLSYFFIYAFMGWVVEVSFQAIHRGRFINRGFLNGPYCPIYGFGACSVIYLLSDIAEKNKLILFLGSILIASTIEFIAGFILEKIFHKRWWDYSDRRLNLGGYICLEFSIIWGMFCFLIHEAVHPIIKDMVALIPLKLLTYLEGFLILLFIADFISTINTLIGLNKKLKLSAKIGGDIRKVSDDIGERVYDRTISFENKKDEIKNMQRVKEFDERSKEFKKRFDKFGERRILKAFPNLIKDLEDRDYQINRIKNMLKDK